MKNNAVHIEMGFQAITLFFLSQRASLTTATCDIPFLNYMNYSQTYRRDVAEETIPHKYIL